MDITYYYIASALSKTNTKQHIMCFIVSIWVLWVDRRRYKYIKGCLFTTIRHILLTLTSSELS